MSYCPFYNVGAKLCGAGAKLSVFTVLVANCPFCYLGAKLSVCILGAKLSVCLLGAKVSGFTIRCQSVLPPFLAKSRVDGQWMDG